MSEKKYLPHTSKYFILALVPVSLVLIFWGIFLSADYNIFMKDAVNAVGVITDVYISTSDDKDVCNAYVEYVVDGVSYEYYIHRYDRGYLLHKNDYIGNMVELLYSSKNPAKARLAEAPYAKSIYMLLAGIAAAVLCYVLYRKNKNFDRIIQNGITLDAIITKIETVNEYELGIQGFLGTRRFDDEPDPIFVIVCEWENPVTGQKYEFKSIQIKEFVEPYVGRTIKVYVDPDNYSKYFVDINSILAQPFNEKTKPFSYNSSRKD